MVLAYQRIPGPVTPSATSWHLPGGYSLPSSSQNAYHLVALPIIPALLLANQGVIKQIRETYILSIQRQAIPHHWGRYAVRKTGIPDQTLLVTSW